MFSYALWLRACVASFFNWRVAAAGSAVWKIEVPATNVFAPACASSAVFPGSTPAIHLDPEARIIPRPHLIQLPNFLVRIGDEFLPAKSRVYRHHQHRIHLIQHFAQHPHRRRRINRRARFRSVLPDHRQRPVQMHRRFLVHQHPVRARAYERPRYTVPGCSIIRCTSRGSRVALRSDATTGIPSEIFGTKCPSIIST